jgi:hypothetical protein
MVKRGKKKEKNFIKWIIVGLLILAVLLIAYKFFTGQVTGNPIFTPGMGPISPSGPGGYNPPVIGVPSDTFSTFNLTNILGGNWTSSITVHAGKSYNNGDMFNISCSRGGTYFSTRTIELTNTVNNTPGYGGTYFSGAYGISFEDLKTNTPVPNYYTDTVWKSDGTAIMPVQVNFAYFNLTLKMTGNYFNSSEQRSVTLSSNGSCSFLCLKGTCIKKCKDLGKSCTSNSNCCSNKCQNNVCKAYCVPKGAFVSSSSQCCGGSRRFWKWLICT